MTIDELSAASGLTGSDEIAVWITGASGEKTQKITATNLTAALKTLGNFLSTTGGTMTGNIEYGSSANRGISWTAGNGTVFEIRHNVSTNRLMVLMTPSGGSQTVMLGFLSDGTISTGVPAAWRSAIGVVAASGSFSVSNLAAGASTSQAISFTTTDTNYVIVTETNMVALVSVNGTGRSSSGATLVVNNIASSAQSGTVRWAVIRTA